MTSISSERERDQTRWGQEGSLVAALAIAPGLTAVVLAIGAHVFTATRVHSGWGASLFGLALILFFLSVVQQGTPVLLWKGALSASPIDENAPLVRSKIWRLALLANCATLAGLAYWVFAGNRLDRGFWLWAAAVFYFLLALGERPLPGWRNRLNTWWRGIDWRVPLLLAGIMALAIFFRVFRLEGVPAEMTSDHAEKLLDVHDVLGGLHPIFFPRNTGREAVQFYLTAALIRVTPLEISHLALKVGTAIVGILTVPWTYLLGKELYGWRVGILTAFFVAVAHWPVTISRIGLRFPFTAAFAAPALFFLCRALRANRRNDWLGAGAFLGAGLHTYTAMRIVPFLFVLLVALRASSDVVDFVGAWWGKLRPARTEFMALSRSYWINAGSSAALSALLFLPLLRYMAENPKAFWYRAASRGAQGLSPVEAWRVFWFNVKNALLMFNFRGDVVPMNTVPETAVLGPVVGGLFVLGLGYASWRLLVNRDRRAGVLVVCCLVMLLPSILSLAYPNENPSVARAGGAIPFVMIIAALPPVLIWERASVLKMRWADRAVAIFLAVLLTASIAFNFDWYFRLYDANIRRSIWNATEMGEVLRDFEHEGGDLGNAYHVAYPYWVDTRNIAINAGDITWRNAVTDLAQIAAQAQRPGRKLYLVHPQDEAALKVLREVYPTGMAHLQTTDRPGKEFYIFEVPAPEN